MLNDIFTVVFKNSVSLVLLNPLIQKATHFFRISHNVYIEISEYQEKYLEKKLNLQEYSKYSSKGKN